MGTQISSGSFVQRLSSKRENFGMKQEPRVNTFEETRRQEVEREIKSIMAADKCDQSTVAKETAGCGGHNSATKKGDYEKRGLSILGPSWIGRVRNLVSFRRSWNRLHVWSVDPVRGRSSKDVRE